MGKEPDGWEEAFKEETRRREKATTFPPSRFEPHPSTTQDDTSSREDCEPNEEPRREDNENR